MNELADSAVHQWRDVQDMHVPAILDVTCPFCSRSVSFSIGWVAAKVDFILFGRGKCPRCHEQPTLVVVNWERMDGNRRKGHVYMSPPTRSRMPLRGLEDATELSAGLKRAYQSAVNVYNQGEWSATAVACRRVLEGLTKTMLPPEKHELPLARQIELLTEHVDLTRPVVTLARALKEGGNLGAHFDLEREPDKEVAEMMVDLLDDLLEYLFVLPQQIEALNGRVTGGP